VDTGELMTTAEQNRWTGGIRVFLYQAPAAEEPTSLFTWREHRSWLLARRFREHLARLESSGHPILPLAEAWCARAVKPPLVSIVSLECPLAPVALTFDLGPDGGNAVAWPLLVRAGLDATFFLHTGELGRPGFLRRSQMREMCAGGARFGTRGHRHEDLTRLGPVALDTELRMSKDLLEGWIQRPVEFLAAPGGRVNARVVDAARKAGYRAVCSTASRPAAPGASVIDRIPVDWGTAPSELAQLLAGERKLYWTRSARAAFLAGPNRRVRPHPPAATPSVQSEAAR
jgi:peptidoglycan/xylan/chitin deacetylase (PgdA/CDA1 family)